jgi:hypothetical protein
MHRLLVTQAGNFDVGLTSLDRAALSAVMIARAMAAYCVRHGLGHLKASGAQPRPSSAPDLSLRLLLPFVEIDISDINDRT